MRPENRRDNAPVARFAGSIAAEATKLQGMIRNPDASGTGRDRPAGALFARPPPAGRARPVHGAHGQA
ncbi:MAG: hypothetical protein CFE34_04760 [Rhodobacteraceae bacterium PARR1]|nr:MAG: hypothetical protein CFE34_04760 [Rhodobacteraceae bacterium PARR1]